MKYRATQQGFIDRIINVGDIVEVEGPLPIAGLVPVEDVPAPVPVEDVPVPVQAVRAARRARAQPPVATSDDADVI